MCLRPGHYSSWTAQTVPCMLPVVLYVYMCVCHCIATVLTLLQNTFHDVGAHVSQQKQRTECSHNEGGLACMLNVDVFKLG